MVFGPSEETNEKVSLGYFAWAVLVYLFYVYKVYTYYVRSL